MDLPFVMNLSNAPALGHPRRATILDFEAERDPFPDTGVNVQILAPGQPNCLYHREPVQEDFLVLAGECIAIIDGAEHSLRRWDFVHCPANVDHVIVGAGDGPCAVLMIGSRRVEAAHYPVNAVAARYGASAARATDDPAEAYAEWRREAPLGEVQNPWPFRTQLPGESYWGALIDTGATGFPRYGLAVDPVPDSAGDIEVLFEDGSVRRFDPGRGSLVDPARLRADDPERYARIVTLIGNYVGR
jgi:uncharacterized cupin superfamily protein